ncbi:MAG: sulfatase-like hydrolase/transferase, partial [SAR202 cluster bacterium]|nr:sulfatase-like hydrolase/transferase [SAR202 cluster bacterium]
EYGPNAHGFDQFFGFLDWTIDYHSHKNVSGFPALYDNTELVEQDGYFTDLVTDHAVSFINQHSHEPFFTFVSYNAPLPPYQRPDRPDDVRAAQTWFDMDRQNYAISIERADEGIGRILDALDANSLSENTVVIFASDHGGDSEISSNRPFFHGFGTLWEGGIRVPCIIRWPGHLPAETECDQLTILTDLSASILSSTGTNPPENRKLDGINIIPILNGTEPDAQRTFFWRIDFDGRQQAAVRQGKWKYLRDGGALPRAAALLFNLEEDVGERQNLAQQYPEVLHDLQRSLAQWEDDIQR